VNVGIDGVVGFSVTMQRIVVANLANVGVDEIKTDFSGCPCRLGAAGGPPLALSRHREPRSRLGLRPTRAIVAFTSGGAASNAVDVQSAQTGGEGVE